MDEYNKTITMSEGPFERIAFPNGVETKNVLSRQIVTRYIQDGYLCESVVDREYRDGDYFDSTRSTRIIKLNG